MEGLTLMQKCFFEFLGTAIMILVGDVVVACTTLNKSKGQGSGWIVITMAWGFAVMCGIFVAGPYSGAHLNPAVSIALAIANHFSWANVPAYVIAQILGGFVGGLLVYLFYKNHFDETEDATTKLGVFCTIPAIRNFKYNVLCEIIGTGLLVFVILALSNSCNCPTVNLGSIGAFPVTMLIMSIGMSLGGTTGYAINPARDLGPRLAHFILPIKGKRNSDWAYSWVPIVGPLVGCCLGGLAYILAY